MSSSTIMTITSIPFVYEYVVHDCNLELFPLLESPFALVSCTFFITYLIADIMFGFIYYPQHMDPWTGWFHHITYLVLIPVLLSNHVGGGFMITMCMELPTVFLSIGYIIPSLRSELLFGMVFFITRILFHLFFAYQLYKVWSDRMGLVICSLLTFPLHVYWFGKWVQRQRNRLSISMFEKYFLLQYVPGFNTVLLELQKEDVVVDS
jgi:hypothetical protein